MTITNLTPSGEYTYVGNGGGAYYTGGSANYTNLTDASDVSLLVLQSANNYVSYPLTDALDILSVTAATVNIRCRNGIVKGDFAKLESVQIFASDGTTAVTSIANQSSTITATTYNLTFSSITLDDITSWNGAVVKVKIDGGTGVGILVYELSVDITYTPNPDRVASGGVKLGYTSPSRYSATYNSGSGNWTVPYDVTSVQIEVWGGGGGGGRGGTGSGSNGASGGGGGGYCKKNALTVTPGDLIAYVVGAGGVTDPGGGDLATAGAQSSVASTYFANGGGAGDYGDDDPSVAASGGTASGGDVNTTGDASLAVSAGNTGSAGGAGASGGAGGAGGIDGSTEVGSPGVAPGGGGGGGAKTEEAGGAGASGRVIFSYDTVLTFTPGPNRMSGLIGTKALSSIINNVMVVPINFPAN